MKPKYRIRYEFDWREGKTKYIIQERFWIFYFNTHYNFYDRRTCELVFLDLIKSHAKKHL